ncbi:MAG TPA: transglutaminase domain-containing protein [Mucilaginibacter sp.]|nr:transglutaminase domain-containing protein [Mucilaginibacter sp.]
MKKILLVLSLFLAALEVSAQDFPYGEVDNNTLDMQKYDKDTSAHAVVLREYGTSRIILDNDDYTKVVFQYHVRIKIFDKSEFDKGTITIPIYNGDNNVYEEVRDITGTTFYKDEKGVEQKAELDPKQVFRTKENKYWTTMKFAMPAVREGCVIEYKYTIYSPHIENFHSWEFQSDIPKMYSEYEVHIPGFWTYNASLKGSLKLTKNVAEVEHECFTFGTAKADCSHMTYGMSEIPAFVSEEYMTSKKNFISSVNFELVQYQNFQTGATTKYTKEWKDLDYQLKTEFWFGGQLKRKELLKERIAPIIGGMTDSMAKAKAVYAFIQKNIKWNDFYAYGSDDGLKKALDSHSGDVADINLTLVTALNAAGIPAEAVMLSTREHGVINYLYPGLGDFNYVIAKTDIGGKTYLLDATDQLLPFGVLPMRCLNDKGRVFSLDKPSYWIDMNTGQREGTTYTLDLTLSDNGKLKGTFSRYSSGYSAYEMRQEIKKFNTEDEFIENLEGKLDKVKILKSSFENLDSLNKPLGETYEIEISAFDNLDHNKLVFNPFLFNRMLTNPFKLAERDYPVDWGMPSDERYILTVHLPEQFQVDNPPQNLAFAMPDNGGKFIINYQGDNGLFVFSNVIQFNKSVYGPDEYPYLKELYNKIILSEKNELVFKKKS